MKDAGRTGHSIRKGGFLDRHPIIVPASIFAIGWIPYLVIFFRKTISFGDLGGAFPVSSLQYWLLFILQLGVCVISHSLTLRTIIRLYAPRWLIFGSIAFFTLSPAWGLLTAADIRHPLFAAVFCVFISSTVFILYSRKTAPWVWVQLAGGALAVCLLRSDGVAVALSGLVLILLYEIKKRSSDPVQPYLDPTSTKHRESRWSDVDAAFLVLTAVGLLTWLSLSLAGGLPLGEPDFGAAPQNIAPFPIEAWGANLTGTHDIAGMIPYDALISNSVLPGVAECVARFFWAQQCSPLMNLTFSWIAFELLFAGFFIWALSLAVRGTVQNAPSHSGSLRAAATKEGSGGLKRDIRPLIIAIPMVVILGGTLIFPADATLRFIMPVLAAQPMLFASCFFSSRTS